MTVLDQDTTLRVNSLIETMAVKMSDQINTKNDDTLIEAGILFLEY